MAVFAVWERVLVTDYSTPTSGVLRLLRSTQVVQYWDPKRELSHVMGEKPGDRESMVWDWIALYRKDAQWTDKPPEPFWSGRPVEDVVGEFKNALARYATTM